VSGIPPTSTSSPFFLFSSISPPHASFVGHLRESVEDADKVIRKEGYSTVDSGRSRYVFRTRLAAYGPRDPIHLTYPRSVSYLQVQSVLWTRKRTPPSQNVAEPPAKGPVRAPSETETPQSSSGSSAPSDEDSELAALRRPCNRSKKICLLSRQDQRQLDDITRGIQHDLDEAQPRDTLRFLEEHFTCAL
jgi:hypothetical protein